MNVLCTYVDHEHNCFQAHKNTSSILNETGNLKIKRSGHVLNSLSGLCVDLSEGIELDPENRIVKSKSTGNGIPVRVNQHSFRLASSMYFSTLFWAPYL